jgi:hypothetical protein
MKELQDDFTTPEQSKRLLELGVPADSANMLYCRCKGDLWGNPQLCYRKYSKYYIDSSFEMLPCWSAGRLMEIYMQSVIYRDIYEFNKFCFDYDANIIDEVIDLIEVAVGLNELDFSKLEE